MSISESLRKAADWIDAHPKTAVLNVSTLDEVITLQLGQAIHELDWHQGVFLPAEAPMPGSSICWTAGAQLVAEAGGLHFVTIIGHEIVWSDAETAA